MEKMTKRYSTSNQKRLKVDLLLPFAVTLLPLNGVFQKQVSLPTNMSAD